MGADMLMTCVSWEKGQALDWDAGFKLIKGLDQKTLKEWTVITKDDLKVKLEAVRSAVEGYSRYAVPFSFGHLTVLIECHGVMLRLKSTETCQTLRKWVASSTP